MVDKALMSMSYMISSCMCLRRAPSFRVLAEFSKVVHCIAVVRLNPAVSQFYEHTI